MRGVDRILYVALIAAIFIAAQFRTPPEPRLPAASDPARPVAPPAERDGGRPLPAPSFFDPNVLVEVDGRSGPSTGSAFAVGPGVWMTAEHVVAGCTRIGLVQNNGRVIPGRAVLTGAADAALIESTATAPAFPVLTDAETLRLGQSGYHIGFPQSRPGEVSSRLLGRQVLTTRGAVRRREAILAWVETARTPGLRGSLGGLSGGPALLGDGTVVGVTIAESPRRGRIFTTAPVSTKALVARGSSPGGTAAPIEPSTFSGVASQLRQNFRVAQVVCL